MTHRPERIFQVFAALSEMRPPIGVDRDDGGAREGGGRLDCVVRVHGEVELAPRSRGSREEEHEAGVEAPIYGCDAVEPNRVAGDVDWPEVPRFRKDHKANDIARKGFDADRPMPGGRCCDLDRAALSIRNFCGFPWAEPLRVARKPACSRLGGENPVRLRKKSAP